MTMFNQETTKMGKEKERIGVVWPDLQATVEPMLTGDYKERFVAEYWQTKIRYERLKKFNTKIRAASAIKDDTGLQPDWTPKHDCPVWMLEAQEKAMREYLHIMEERAEIEGIILSFIQ